MSRLQRVKIEKVVVSSGLATRDSAHIQRANEHLTELLKKLNLEDFKVLNTKCHNVVSKWNKKGQVMGLKTDFRKHNADKLMKHLWKTGLVEKMKVNGRTCYIPLEDHRQLKLEKYSHTAPEYGLAIQVVLMPEIYRPYVKKGPGRARRRPVLVVSREAVLQAIKDAYDDRAASELVEQEGLPLPKKPNRNKISGTRSKGVDSERPTDTNKKEARGPREEC